MHNNSHALPFISGSEIHEQIDPDRARELIESALLEGFDPSTDPARSQVDAGQGHLLLMPSTLGNSVGVKLASVAPDNPAFGLPRIQAIYLVMDAATLTPRALLDGSVLTELRTPATSAVACDRLAAPEASRMVVFGNGPQAVEHVIAMSRIRTLSDIRLVGRNPERAQRALDALRDRGVDASLGRAGDVAEADIIICATSASTPLFDGSLVCDGACVVAMGSHSPADRELDGSLVGRSLVIVEDVQTALREAGDVVLAIDEGELSRDDLLTLAPLVRGDVRRAADRPNVFKGSGMSWQDLAVAAGVDLDA